MRVLYPDQDSFEMVGEQGYGALHRKGRFHTQMKMRMHSGGDLWVDLSSATLSETESIWMVVDINQLKHSEASAQHLALHDPLTGLANRRLFEELLQQAVAQAGRQRQGLAVCYMDLDGFKPINDRHGHEAGDVVLREVGERLRCELRSNDSVARLGGDEFAWLLSGVDDEAEARAVLGRCLARVQQAIPLGEGRSVRVDASIGLVLDGRQEHSAQALLQAADAAMYQAKRAGTGVIATGTVLRPG